MPGLAVVTNASPIGNFVGSILAPLQTFTIGPAATGAATAVVDGAVAATVLVVALFVVALFVVAFVEVAVLFVVVVDFFVADFVVVDFVFVVAALVEVALDATQMPVIAAAIANTPETETRRGDRPGGGEVGSCVVMRGSLRRKPQRNLRTDEVRSEFQPSLVGRFNGMVTVNVVPSASLLCTSIDPPCAVTIDSTIASPNPDEFEADASFARQNRWNSRSRSTGLIPGPVL